MSSSFKLKIIALESTKSAKDFFFSNSHVIHNRFSTNYKLTVGVDILTADCLFDNSDEYATLSIWDIENKSRFDFIRSTFYRGAAGVLIFTFLNDESINSSVSLISEIRTYTENAPIFLVGILNNEEFYEYNIDEIESLVENQDLNGYFLIPDQINIVLSELTRTIIYNRMNGTPNFTYKNLDYATKEKYSSFIRFFTTCPCCLTPLHKSYLWSFLSSLEPHKIELKNRLLLLMDEAREFDNLYYNRIRLGIPCCSCFKNIF